MDYSRGVLKALNSPFFPIMRRNLGPYLVDKTELIKNIVVNDWTGNIHLVLRPRRCGKSTMLQMIQSFFSIPRNGDPDPRLLFKGLHTAEYGQDICTEHMGKYPVLFCDFKKDFTGRSWEEMLSDFKFLASRLYGKWEDCLMQSLRPEDKTYYESICFRTATEAELTQSLYKLSYFLAQKFGRKVIVLIDEYEVPSNRAFERGYLDKANEFLWRGALAALLKSNENLQYAVLVGVTPASKCGLFSILNNLETHALHTSCSIFAGMLLFTEPEVGKLIKLSNSELELEDLRAHYNSYKAAGSAGHINVYNPVSVMSALKRSSIEDFWVATGEFPPLNREFSDDDLGVAENLLVGNEIEFELMESVTYSNFLTICQNEALTLLYYAGYLTMTGNDRFKIPNREVMTDWAGWIIGDVSPGEILKTCVEGPVNHFEAEWPNFMQQILHLATRDRGVNSHKTLERFYHVFLLGLMQSLGTNGWEVTVTVEARAGVHIRLLHKRKGKDVLIMLKSSEKPGDMKRDASKALEQTVDKNYRNLDGLPSNCTLREYGIAAFHLTSYVKGRYLELNSRGQWVEKDDPAMSVF